MKVLQIICSLLPLHTLQEDPYHSLIHSVTKKQIFFPYYHTCDSIYYNGSQVSVIAAF